MKNLLQDTTQVVADRYGTDVAVRYEQLLNPLVNENTFITGTDTMQVIELNRAWDRILSPIKDTTELRAWLSTCDYDAYLQYFSQHWLSDVHALGLLN